MAETYSLTNFALIKQKQLAEFDAFLRALHSNFGKSVTQDPHRTIAEIRALAVTEGRKHGVLSGATRNRHMTFLEQLIRYAREAMAIAIDANVKTTPFRARKNTRARDERETPNQTQVKKLFAQPIFHGYQDWKRINTAGDEFYHRGEYFCSILAPYLGGRREEYCGLSVKDVITDNGPNPYIHIAPNSIRRIKNKQSTRNVALHPEVIRLGFLDYVKEIQALGYDRLFPDLYSPSTRSPMGDRYYDQMLPSMKASGFTPHQVRHFFGDELKQKKVSAEFRADFLGHGGKNETTERYCNPISIEVQMDSLMLLPTVTADLQPRPIKLLPWVVEKAVAPWSRTAQKARMESTSLVN